jgi:putative hydroxymethylpyrimidine transport system substrate-binding protein
MRARGALAALVLLLAAGPSACGSGDDQSSAGARPVTLALDFQPNAVHAGVFTTVARHLDRRHGLALRVRAPAASTDSLKLLASGRADFAIVDIHDLGLARQRGEDVVGVGAIVQRPLAAVIARRSVRRPRDLQGRRVGVTGLPSDDAVLNAEVSADGGRPARVRRTTIGFSAVPSLTAGKVDAVVTFWNAEGVALRRRGVRTRQFRVDRYGAPRYPELVVAARRATLHRDPALARRLTAALADGTRAAEADLPRAASLVAARADADPGLTLAQLRAVAPAFDPPLVLRRSALEGWAHFDARFGILRNRPDVDRAFVLR